MKLLVGQVVFLLTGKSSKVYPALVSEEIKKRSLSGETTNYVVRLPTEDAREVEISKLDAEVFETIESARETILDRISTQVDKMLDEAVSMSNVFSNDIIKTEPETDKDSLVTEDLEIHSTDSDESFALVDLGDGNVARMSVKNAEEVIGVQG